MASDSPPSCSGCCAGIRAGTAPVLPSSSAAAAVKAPSRGFVMLLGPLPALPCNRAGCQCAPAAAAAAAVAPASLSSSCKCCCCCCPAGLCWGVLRRAAAGIVAVEWGVAAAATAPPAPPAGLQAAPKAAPPAAVTSVGVASCCPAPAPAASASWLGESDCGCGVAQEPESDCAAGDAAPPAAAAVLLCAGSAAGGAAGWPLLRPLLGLCVALPRKAGCSPRIAASVLTARPLRRLGEPEPGDGPPAPAAAAAASAVVVVGLPTPASRLYRCLKPAAAQQPVAFVHVCSSDPQEPRYIA